MLLRNHMTSTTPVIGQYTLDHQPSCLQVGKNILKNKENQIYSPSLLSVLPLQLDLHLLFDPFLQEVPGGPESLGAPEGPVSPRDPEHPAVRNWDTMFKEPYILNFKVFNNIDLTGIFYFKIENT